MFLKDLKEEQKELFAQLCIHTAWANGIVKDEEEYLINEYCREMSIEYPGTEAKIELNDVLSQLKEISTKNELNAMTFEIAAIFVSDRKYSDDEAELMAELMEKFDIEKEKVDRMLELLDQYNSLLGEIIEVVTE